LPWAASCASPRAFTSIGKGAAFDDDLALAVARGMAQTKPISSRANRGGEDIGRFAGAREPTWRGAHATTMLSL
jgi:hypothetical protein